MERELSKDILRDEHNSDIEKFECEKHEDIYTFLNEKAIIYQASGVANTTLYYDDKDNLVGFYTLFNDHIEISKNKIRSYRLPSNLTFFPSVRLHYFATDSRYQEQGIGTFMLGDIFRNCLSLSTFSGCTFINLQAKQDAIEWYEKRGFEPIGSLSRGLQDMILPIRKLIKPL
ncbi:GNAT family N-acetyltransferase [Bacillus spizizenii]|nr:GNAT family N-acetyltransferase [Bacillus spizizenii]MCY9244019.1 GNAT family N-acetyltransferase [Bacillus spizizenii]MCY9326439.1 GNAT family N-acetyltransferase [Bacillus spizizenii]